MAKKSAIENNNKKKRMVLAKDEARKKIKAMLCDRDLSIEVRIAAVHKLAEMPRNSSSVRVRNRCSLTGRPRGFYRKFGVSRIALRDLGSAGFLPGVVKASW